MDCREFERWIELRGVAVERDSAAGAYHRHANGCTDCRELLVLIELSEAEPALSAEWTRQVVTATSGSPCDVVESWIGDRSRSGAPDATAEQLVQAHLAGCGDCTELAKILDRLDRDLTDLRELSVPPGFADQVLARTLPLDVRLRRRFGHLWQGWLRRPRFATELAYALTVLLLIVVGNPTAPLSAMSKSARELSPVVDSLAAKAQPREAVANLKRSVAESEAVGLFAGLGDWFGQQGSELQALGEQGLDQAAEALEATAAFAKGLY